VKKKDMSEAEKWRAHQAKVLLESMCLEIEPGEKFEDGGVTLIVDGNHSAMQCSKCREKWDVNKIMLKNGLTKIQAFVPWGLGYRLFFNCPHGCNKAYSWKENFQWISILKDID
jgi:hypothetical protein